MRRKRFFFIEPSKVGRQHITLIEGYLRALVSSATLARSFDLFACVSASTFASLSATTRESIKHLPIRVMDPERRRLFRKTLLEFVVVLRYLLTMRRGDVVFVSCVLPTTLLLLELVNAVLRRRGFFVSLHGEIEGMFDESLRHFRNFGFWTMQWMRVRRRGSRLSLVVIDDFIKRELLRAYPGKLRDSDIFVIHHPVSPFSGAEAPDPQVRTVCFIGYRTRFKGFDQFRKLSALYPDVAFLAIGGGCVEDVRTGCKTSLSCNDEYLRSISECSVALFPYVAGYTCSLSAAALDALSTGLHLVASDRGCFLSLAENLGPDVITICRSLEEIRALLDDPQWLGRVQAGKGRRLERLMNSHYGHDSVRAAFEKLLNVHAGQSMIDATL